jgi:hypothetical protein
MDHLSISLFRPRSSSGRIGNDGDGDGGQQDNQDDEDEDGDTDKDGQTRSEGIHQNRAMSIQ